LGGIMASAAEGVEEAWGVIGSWTTSGAAVAMFKFGASIAALSRQARQNTLRL